VSSKNPDQHNQIFIDNRKLLYVKLTSSFSQQLRDSQFKYIVQKSLEYKTNTMLTLDVFEESSISNHNW